MLNIAALIAQELKTTPEQVSTVMALLAQGDTIPFIARYRKEATGGLDDIQLRLLEERLRYLTELEERRAVILKSIRDQDKLIPELEASINEADSKARLEDLYLPYKPKRRTKAQIAIEAGLEPLAEFLSTRLDVLPEIAALPFVNEEKGIDSTKAALEGARFILMEKISVQADLLGELRQILMTSAYLKSRVQVGKNDAGEKFKDYFDYQERLNQIPSHRILAVLRGRNEGFLTVSIGLDDEESKETTSIFEKTIARAIQLNENSEAYPWLAETVRWSWKIKLQPSLELELINQLREAAELQAIQVFAHNLRDLLMCSPAGPRPTLGLDPGLRTGVKYAVVEHTGKVTDFGAIFPHVPRKEWEKSILVLAALCEKHNIELISIGNGTASRETEQLVADLQKTHPHLKITKVIVSEAGASVYSASALASSEFPNMDVSYRGAVSIARRLQDPLSELVKIDPKAIGVGQYQHDVSQVALSRSLDAVVEDCVNAVGVDVNTASVPLLARVSGLNQNLATNIVAFRDKFGAFTNRTKLKEVSRLGPKAFEQAAGFLRIINGENPLDASGVHPEAYNLVEAMVNSHQQDVKKVIGNSPFLKKIDPQQFISTSYGLPTILDILKELEKPGRDPRPEFKTAQFKKNVSEIQDVKPGMLLEGVVTNVANFGAFVDIGVHQDGLVHISELADRFVSNPREVVKTGNIVTVKVLEVDPKRRRIALTLRLSAEAPKAQPNRDTASMRSSAKFPKKTSSETVRTPSLFGATLLNALKQPVK